MFDYYQVREWLESFIPFTWTKAELGLERPKYLLKLLGNPQNKFKSIHVAGTSGKGSTAYYTARLLAENFKFQISNFKLRKVGLHISPHLVDIRERMQVFSLPRHPGGSETTDKRACFSQARNKRACFLAALENRISKSDSIASLQNDGSLMPMGRFLRLFNEIAPVVEKIKRDNPDLTPSYFEILVAASFKYFADEKVDWAVVEVGLGGRLDATNVLQPKVSVITNIGLDHTEILGKTVEKIAYEKAGIIKKGVPVVTTAGGRVLEVIAEVAKKQQAPLITIDTQDALLANKLLAVEAVNLVLRGAKRRGNLKRLDRHASLAMTKGGLPGRFEEIVPGVILDGAHNPDKIRALLEFIGKSKVKSQKSKVGGVILVIGFKKGKQWKKMVDLLIKNLPIKQVIATKFHAVTDTGRFAAVEPEEIRNYVAKVYSLPTTVYSNSQEAVFEALNASVIASTFDKLSVNSVKQSKLKIAASFDIQCHAVLANAAGLELRTRNDKRLVLVTGSLYLVGEVRTLWELPAF